ncbi:tRNA (adenosine(37)-N6)-threonylcarbamoyltransferase complex dimerization subunit type 1 TsaB [Cellulomonas sp. ATA003]|uniref:tRNA (adenosine(37)-N6)-threonylcarbamoyltransferase complex dimerization subunit type 1 TsaB n=1 Tax=Cellulomonas sp. ATA003 TaxID=3073064 RepID=UPI002873C052|nr:tRNA (adenosine(37)-N6)-threonylcarbamoyltransferase complex dimerization subunit type 1 TsaB [Cellulomonas sp. ATA003]WNB86037.1 tRNA (adenosine(37)-N6)-threonylcarbamoyltransferase complex dimerization subunit type 1 TsaB [Cellulomonas sp. ATA003]
MPVLALDTSAAVAVALTTDEGAPLAARHLTEERRHAELLAPMVTDVLRDAGVDRRDLTAVVVGTGPAPFTGLRVGLVTARTLALALGVPVLGVCSLDALAAQAVADLGLAPGGEVLVATDARRREVYWARYRVGPAGDPAGDPAGAAEVEPLTGPAVARPAQLADDGVADGAVVVGRGAALYPDHLTGAAGAPLDPDPAVLARLALARRTRGVAQPSEPLYLRRPDVMEPAARKRALG